jgi:hypothetical protein
MDIIVDNVQKFSCVCVSSEGKPSSYYGERCEGYTPPKAVKSGYVRRIVDWATVEASATLFDGDGANGIIKSSLTFPNYGTVESTTSFPKYEGDSEETGCLYDFPCGSGKRTLRKYCVDIKDDSNEVRLRDLQDCNELVPDDKFSESQTCRSLLGEKQYYPESCTCRRDPDMEYLLEDLTLNPLTFENGAEWVPTCKSFEVDPTGNQFSVVSVGSLYCDNGELLQTGWCEAIKVKEEGAGVDTGVTEVATVEVAVKTEVKQLLVLPTPDSVALANDCEKKKGYIDAQSGAVRATFAALGGIPLEDVVIDCFRLDAPEFSTEEDKNLCGLGCGTQPCESFTCDLILDESSTNDDLNGFKASMQVASQVDTKNQSASTTEKLDNLSNLASSPDFVPKLYSETKKSFAASTAPLPNPPSINPNSMVAFPPQKERKVTRKTVVKQIEVPKVPEVYTVRTFNITMILEMKTSLTVEEMSKDEELKSVLIKGFVNTAGSDLVPAKDMSIKHIKEVTVQSVRKLNELDESFVIVSNGVSVRGSIDSEDHSWGEEDTEENKLEMQIVSQRRDSTSLELIRGLQSTSVTRKMDVGFQLSTLDPATADAIDQSVKAKTLVDFDTGFTQAFSTAPNTLTNKYNFVQTLSQSGNLDLEPVTVTTLAPVVVDSSNTTNTTGVDLVPIGGGTTTTFVTGGDSDSTGLLIAFAIVGVLCVLGLGLAFHKHGENTHLKKQKTLLESELDTVEKDRASSKKQRDSHLSADDIEIDFGDFNRKTSERESQNFELRISVKPSMESEGDADEIGLEILPDYLTFQANAPNRRPTKIGGENDVMAWAVPGTIAGSGSGFFDEKSTFVMNDDIEYNYKGEWCKGHISDIDPKSQDVTVIFTIPSTGQKAKKRVPKETCQDPSKIKRLEENENDDIDIGPVVDRNNGLNITDNTVTFSPRAQSHQRPGEDKNIIENNNNSTVLNDFSSLQGKDFKRIPIEYKRKNHDWVPASIMSIEDKGATMHLKFKENKKWGKKKVRAKEGHVRIRNDILNL